MIEAEPNTAPAAAPPDMTVSWRLDAIIAVIAFLTVVDLFATQAILPTLTKAYGVSPAAMGTAVNASTLGMAVAGLLVGSISQLIDRRRGIVLSLVLLSVPTSLLSIAPDLTTFAILRVLQGLCMSAAFTLTLAYLADETSGAATATAIAAYITGNVASNLFGRMLSASVADMYGLSTNFLVFAALNLMGTALVYVALTGMHGRTVRLDQVRAPWAVWMELLAKPALRAGFGIGFCILFAFIGTFTYVNFVLVRPPISLGMMSLGFVYLVFLPAIVTTPLAGWFVDRFGVSATLRAALAAAGTNPHTRCRWAHVDRSGHVFRPGHRSRVRQSRRPSAVWACQRALSGELLFRRAGRKRRSRPSVRVVWMARVRRWHRACARPGR
jgi:predicted MFS family arabinose efflux permease